MTDTDKSLKSLHLAGVEWEILDSYQYGHSAPGQRDRTDCPAAMPSPAILDGGTNPAFIVPKSQPVIPSTNIMEIATRLANEPNLADGIKQFREHPLFNGAKNTVLPSIINPQSSTLLVITDIPSLSDDASGKILSGAEGDLFDKMMAAIGLSRKDITITPLVFWRPAGGRTLTDDELRFCRPFIERIIRDNGAKRILTLGALAAKEIAGGTLPRDHGKQCTVYNAECTMIYKPEFIMQNPNMKRDVWTALQLLNNE